MDNLRITAKGIKREALGLLRNNWSRALGALSIYLMMLVLFIQISQLVSALLSEFGPGSGGPALSELRSFDDYLEYFTTGGMGINLLVLLAMSFFFFILSAPLSLGITYWFRNLSLLKNLQVGQIFRYYQNNNLFFSAVTFQAMNTVLNILFAIVSFLPAAACFGWAYLTGLSGGSSTTQVIIGCVLALAGLLAFMALSLRLFFAKYLFCGDYGYGAFDCIKYSNKYMKKHVGSVMGVIFSFALWFVSCIFILPLAYVIPFYNASMAACAQDIIDEHMGQTLEQLQQSRDRHNAA